MSSVIPGQAVQTVSSRLGIAGVCRPLCLMMPAGIPGHSLTAYCLSIVGAAAGGYHRGPDFGDVQERRKFMKRLEQSELEKVNQRFQPMLQAAAVSYEVIVRIRTPHCPMCLPFCLHQSPRPQNRH